MREERGQISGNQVVSESIDFWGSILGDVTVIDGGKMYMRGAIYGSLRVQTGGRVHIFGNVSRDVHVAKGAKVIVSGVVGGDCVNEGGRLTVDSTGRVIGKVKTRDGKTSVDSKAQIGS